MSSRTPGVVAIGTIKTVDNRARERLSLTRVLRWFAAFLVLLVLVHSTGLEWLAPDACCPSETERQDDSAPCGPSCDDCSCCFSVRVVVPSSQIVTLAPPVRVVMIVPIARRVPSPSPREILHVPIARLA